MYLLSKIYFTRDFWVKSVSSKNVSQVVTAMKTGRESPLNQQVTLTLIMS